jgi:hypothetical protein
MGTRGRKSAEELSLVVIDTQHRRLKPPDFLTANEAEIFTSIVDSSDPKAFRRAELPLLCAYVQALSLSRWYALKVNETGDGESFKRWESATRTAVSLATKLRLAPSTRLDKKTAERMGEEPEGPKPWDLPA